MPFVEEVSFYLFVAKRQMIFMNESSFSSRIENEMHSLLNYFNLSSPTFYFDSINSFGTPFHLTSPPNTDLDALPDPNRANYESYFSSKMLPNNPLRAVAKQAKPDADEAIPEAVGKELVDST